MLHLPTRMIVVLLVIITASAPHALADMPPIYSRSSEAVRNDSYGAFFKDFGLGSDYTGSGQDAMAPLYSFAGRTDQTFKMGLGITKPITCVPDGDVKEVADPISYSIEQAKGRRIFMMNEHHMVPYQRVLLLNSLENFYAAGYRYLAIEAITNTGPNSATDPDKIDLGFYTEDPIFAAAIRKAISIGMTIIPYEWYGEQIIPNTENYIDRIIAREKAQAFNVANALSDVPVEEKTLVYAGHAHIRKGRFGKNPDILAMAGELQNILGEEVYSLNTAACTFVATAIESPKLYVQSNGKKATYPYDGFNDLYDGLLHLPIPTPDDIFPGYFRRFIGKPMNIPTELRELSPSILIEAYKKGQATDTTPYDRLWLNDGESFPMYLPKGDFVLIAYDDHGTTLGKVSVTSSTKD